MSTFYGCHNRKPLKDAATVPDGWVLMARHVQARITVSVPDLMSNDCRYTLTDLGRSLRPVLDAMEAWGKAYQENAR